MLISLILQPAPSQNKLFDSEESTRVVEKSVKSNNFLSQIWNLEDQIPCANYFLIHCLILLKKAVSLSKVHDSLSQMQETNFAGRSIWKELDQWINSFKWYKRDYISHFRRLRSWLSDSNLSTCRRTTCSLLL